MEDKLTRKRIQKIMQEKPFFMEGLMKQIESNKSFELYLENMVHYNGQDEFIAASNTKEATTA